MSSRVGGAVTPPLVVLIIASAGWRAAFWVFGFLGVVWSVFWWRWFRDDPALHPAVDREELAHIQEGAAPAVHPRIDWRDLLHPNLVIICLMYFCIGYGLYFYLTWLPTYFKEARGFSNSQAAWLASGVLLTGGVATMAGGWLTDRLVASRGLKIGRSIGGVAMPLSGAFIGSAALVENPIAAAVLMALAAGVRGHVPEPELGDVSRRRRGGRRHRDRLHEHVRQPSAARSVRSSSATRCSGGARGRCHWSSPRAST